VTRLKRTNGDLLISPLRDGFTSSLGEGGFEESVDSLSVGGGVAGDVEAKIPRRVMSFLQVGHCDMDFLSSRFSLSNRPLVF